MKRCWFGAVLLLALLVGGLLVTRCMTENHEAVSKCLDRAAEAAMGHNWREAENNLNRAHRDWKGKWHFSAAFADHEPMEDIDGLFAQAKVYLQRHDAEALAAVCAQLSTMTQAMGEAHELNWWNLL